MKRQPWISDYDKHLFSEGNHFRVFEKLGAHPDEVNGVQGFHFAVWAPNAKHISVIGDFNNWDELQNPLSPQGATGIWHTFVPNVRQGSSYKYSIHSALNAYHEFKADPYAFLGEVPPRSASVAWDIRDYAWKDEEWMENRKNSHDLGRPLLIYELHLGSWRRNPEENNRYLSYRELADVLPEYVRDLGFTHVELLPITEHPFDGSWGYQSLGLFAPTSRFGTPQDFMYLIDRFHEAGIGVIVDWVPGHFPTDSHGLGYFDGSHLFEHADQRQGFHPDWATYIFNFGRTEVQNFLIASALFWLEKYHVDGLRVDAVASMLYLDYSRNEGEWIPNSFGGRENLEAIAFLKRLNELIYERFPGVCTLAEESTAWPMVSRPTYVGGLGFGYKWNMGWMNDVLSYMSKEPVHRSYHHNNLTFGLLYAFHENFVLPFSHDEVVHGKRSMLSKMPGDDWQKFANLRLLYGFMYGHPGKKLLFMGAEIAQWREWVSSESLDWHLLDCEPHRGVQQWVKDLNWFLRSEPALYERDHEHQGFRWVDCHDSQQSVLSFLRFGHHQEDAILCVLNFTPVPRQFYRLGVPFGGFWEECMNSDSKLYGGSDMGNLGGVFAEEIPAHDFPFSLSLTLPPLGALFFRVSRV